MTLVKVIYDNGSNGFVKVSREARIAGKRVAEMSAQEIMATGFGLFR